MSGLSEKLRFTARQLKNPALSEEERNSIMRKAQANQLVWIRRDIRGVINKLTPLYPLRKEMRQLLKIEQAKTFKNRDNIVLLEEACEALDDQIASWKDVLAGQGNMALSLLEWYEISGATVHDFAQVTGCNMRKVEKAYSKLIDRRERKEKNSSNRIFVELIFVGMVEEAVSVRESEHSDVS